MVIEAQHEANYETEESSVIGFQRKTKPYMDYSAFKEIIDSITGLIDEMESFTDSVQKFCDGHLILTIGQKQITSIIHSVEETVRGKKLATWHDAPWSDIEWWLFETDRGRKRAIIDANGIEYNVAHLKDLYNYIREGRYDV